MEQRTGTCDEKTFWTVVEEIGWGTKTTDFQSVRASLICVWDEAFAESFRDLLHSFQVKLMRRIESFERQEGASCGCGDDGFSDLTNHIVGLGQEEFEATMEDPMRAVTRGQKYEYEESFSYCIPYKSDFEMASDGVYIERAREIVEDLTELKNSGLGEFEDLEDLLQLMTQVINGDVGLLLTEGLQERVKVLREAREELYQKKMEELSVLQPPGWLFDNTVLDAHAYLKPRKSA